MHPKIQPSLLFGNLYWLSVSISYVLGALNVSQNLILKAWAMPFGVTFWYHSQKSTSSRFNVLSGSCLTAGGHAALFINQVCIILVNSFTIPSGITNRVGQEAWACAFSCFRACDNFGGVFRPLLFPGYYQGILESRAFKGTCVLPHVPASSCLSERPR